MSFADLMPDLDEAVSADLCEPAVWTPAGGGGPFAIRVQPEEREVPFDLQGVGKHASTRRLFHVAASEIEAVAPGQRPRRGDVFAFGGESLTISDEPRREDEGRRWWTFSAH